MELFLIPLGPGRYELYCESSHDPVAETGGRPRGLFGRLVQRFHVVLDRVEREHHRPPSLPPPDAGRLRRAGARVRRRLVRWLAGKVAEQRVLWRLRGERQATAAYPGDLSPAEAMAVIRRRLEEDARRHGRWLYVNGAGLVLSGILMPIPGPNLVAYYFAFRVVGHYLSRRGARDGLDCVSWRLEPSEALADLRRALDLSPGERDAEVHNIASRLRLAHLASFFDRVVLPTP